MGIDAKRTFELYARRWCIEVAHKEMKGLLNLGKCQCVDFAGQIAALSLCMIQYNILGTVKRFESYETIGGLNHLRNLSKYFNNLTFSSLSPCCPRNFGAVNFFCRVFDAGGQKQKNLAPA